MPELTVSEWAKKQGISRQAAYKRIKAGKVKLTASGKIDLEQASGQWEKNKDLRQQLRGAPQVKTKAARRESKPAKAQTPERDDSLSAAQRAREWIKVGKEQIQLQKLQGSVLAKDEIERVWSSLISAARSRLLLLPDRIAPRVAVMTEVVEVRQAIDQEIRAALSALSENDESGS